MTQKNIYSITDILKWHQIGIRSAYRRNIDMTSRRRTASTSRWWNQI